MASDEGNQVEQAAAVVRSQSQVSSLAFGAAMGGFALAFAGFVIIQSTVLTSIGGAIVVVAGSIGVLNILTGKERLVEAHGVLQRHEKRSLRKLLGSDLADPRWDAAEQALDDITRLTPYKSEAERAANLAAKELLNRFRDLQKIAKTLESLGGDDGRRPKLEARSAELDQQVSALADKLKDLQVEITVADVAAANKATNDIIALVRSQAAAGRRSKEEEGGSDLEKFVRRTKGA